MRMFVIYPLFLRCKEGYQGVRCDQFLPKTDSILSDPTDHLGIEFMGAVGYWHVEKRKDIIPTLADCL
ncbi:hypothetical protein Q9233_009946 [Columba guinea]|nr:hypothetical protein Q9233_009946 [Columba guinea]